MSDSHFDTLREDILLEFDEDHARFLANFHNNLPFDFGLEAVKAERQTRREVNAEQDRLHILENLTRKRSERTSQLAQQRTQTRKKRVAKVDSFLESRA